MKILIVDDDTLILEILDLYLRTIGYADVHCVTSGDAALDQIKASVTPFEVILLDISMPRLSGIELIPMIQQQAGYHETPIIMMTAMSDRKYIATAFVAGAFDYVTKPFEFFELEAQLQAAKIRSSELRFRKSPEDIADEGLDQLVRNFCASYRCPNGQYAAESGLLGEAEFENCLRRIRTETSRSPDPVTLHIRGVSVLPIEQRQDGAQHYLTVLAACIAEQIRPISGIATYLGDGTFIAVTFGTAQPDLAAALRQAVLLSDQTYGGRVHVGPDYTSAAGRPHGLSSQADPSYLVYRLQKYLTEEQ